MKITKQCLSDVSSLIFDGFLTNDIFITDTYITLRSLRHDERNQILEKYKYLGKAYNFLVIIELLAKSIYKIGGIEVEENVFGKLRKTRSSFIMFLYEKYSKIEERISEASNVLEYYIESSDSKYYWNIYKENKMSLKLEEVKKINQFQYYWIVMNSNKDLVEHEKREWGRIEYMTNSICAFLNPKEYRRLKGKMNVTDRFNDDEKTIEKNRVLALLEKGEEENIEVEEKQEINNEGFIEVDRKIVDQMKRKEDESKEEYTERVNGLMKKAISGQTVDEHDEIVRRYEIRILKTMLSERRIKNLVSKELKNRKRLAKDEDMNQGIMKDGVFREGVVEIGSEDKIEELNETVKSGSFYFEGINYDDIIGEKGFCSIPLERKKEAFKEIMELEIDVKKETDAFIELQKKDKGKTTESEIETDRELQNDSDKVINDGSELKSAAEKAASMNVSDDKNLVKEKIKEKREKFKRYNSAMDKRNRVLGVEDDSDGMFFG